MRSRALSMVLQKTISHSKYPSHHSHSIRQPLAGAISKRIAAHHELVCRPSVVCALSTEHRQTLVIDAEGDWEVESIPSWCELSQNSGSKKNEITLP